MSAIIQITALGQYVAVVVDSNDHPIESSNPLNSLIEATNFCSESKLSWALGWTFMEVC